MSSGYGRYRMKRGRNWQKVMEWSFSRRVQNKTETSRKPFTIWRRRSNKRYLWRIGFQLGEMSTAEPKYKEPKTKKPLKTAADTWLNSTTSYINSRMQRLKNVILTKSFECRFFHFDHLSNRIEDIITLSTH